MMRGGYSACIIGHDPAEADQVQILTLNADREEKFITQIEFRHYCGVACVYGK